MALTDENGESNDIVGTRTIIRTPKQAIFHSAELLKQEIVVQGKLVALDLERRRLDIAEGGGKLIVRLMNDEQCQVAASIWNKALVVEEDSTSRADALLLQVQGKLKKEQRRTFLEATKIRKLRS